MTPATRRRQFVQLERKVAFARKGKRQEAQAVIRAERLKDLRAVADRTRDGWMPPEPVQIDMLAGRSP
jgi:hypothetical protein